MCGASRKISLMGILAIVVATLVFPIQGFAIDSKVQMTGEDFSVACTRADESWISFCDGYIQAVIDSLGDDDRVCLPVGTTRADLVTLTEKEISGSSRLRALNAHDAVRSVIRRFYPCQ